MDALLRNARTIPHMFMVATLEDLPTLRSNQVDDLKLEGLDTFDHNGTTYEGVRVWLSRPSVPGPGIITVEFLSGYGRWSTLIRYSGGRS